MRLFARIAAQPASVLLGVVLAMGLFLAGVGVTLFTGRVLASHDDPTTVHACVNQNSFVAKIFPTGQRPNCNGNEILVEWQSAAGTAGLAAQVDALKTENASQQAEIDALEARLAEIACIQSAAGANPAVDDIVFTGCNVQIVNGTGSTLTTNAVGNLIVGYNENDFAAARTGSHNIVAGMNNDYTSFGGLVAGLRNAISGAFSSVSGGEFNRASEFASSVSGGTNNDASEFWSSVSGGSGNEAKGNYSSISGGQGNEASGENSSISGGQDNFARGAYSSVSGGSFNRAGTETGGGYASVSGGRENFALSLYSSVSGGNRNFAGTVAIDAEYSSVSGGQSNMALGDYSSISGGINNEASGDRSSVGGGLNNTASATNSTVGGGTNLTNNTVGTFIP